MHQDWQLVQILDLHIIATVAITAREERYLAVVIMWGLTEECGTLCEVLRNVGCF